MEGRQGGRKEGRRDFFKAQAKFKEFDCLNVTKTYKKIEKKKLCYTGKMAYQKRKKNTSIVSNAKMLNNITPQ